MNTEPLENTINKNPSVEKFILTMCPGLRIRIYNSYDKCNKTYLGLIKPALENWDFQADVYKKEFGELFESTYSIDGFIAYSMFAVGMPSSLATMKSLYNSSAISGSLVIFAAASAYKKTHGEFPPTLELAMSEVNLPMPIDLTTKKVVGYRLEESKPVVWFAGVDGQDNGAMSAYQLSNYFNPTFGKDLIFYYNKLPFESNN